MRKSEYPKEIKTLGAMIRKKRMDLGMSLLELSKQIKTVKGKLTESYLSRIEAGQKIPSIEVAEQIAKTLGADPFPYQEFIASDALKKTFAKSSSTINIDKIHLIIQPKKPTK